MDIWVKIIGVKVLWIFQRQKASLYYWMKTEILVTTISEIPTETETSTTNDKIDKYLELVGGKWN